MSETVTSAHSGEIRVVETQPTRFDVRLADPSGDRLIISDDNGRPLVTCRADGTVKYGPNCDLDAASRRFWEALARAFPGPWIA